MHSSAKTPAILSILSGFFCVKASSQTGVVLCCLLWSSDCHLKMDNLLLLIIKSGKRERSILKSLNHSIVHNVKCVKWSLNKLWLIKFVHKIVPQHENFWFHNISTYMQVFCNPCVSSIEHQDVTIFTCLFHMFFARDHLFDCSRQFWRGLVAAA